MTAAALTRGRPPVSPGLLIILAVPFCLCLAALMVVSPMLTVALVCLIALVVGILVWPEIVTLVVVFFLFIGAPAVAVNTHGAPLVVVAAFPFLLAIPVVQHLLAGRRLIVDGALVALLVLFLVEVLSTLFSAHQPEAFEKLQTVAIEGVLLYFLVFNAIRTPGALRRALWMIVLACAALALITVYQKTTAQWERPFAGFGVVEASFFLGKGIPPRPSGPLGDPNYYAQILLVGVALGLMLIWYERRVLLRVGAIAATSLSLVAIMITDSRGASLGFLLVLVVMGVLGLIRARQALIGLLALVLLVSFVPGYKDRVATLASAGTAVQEEGADPNADLSVASRSGEMLAAGLVLLDHPFLGVGPANFPLYYQQYARRLQLPVHDSNKVGKDKGAEAERQSHNMFLSIAADLGFPGFFAFCAVLFLAVRDLLRGRRAALRQRPEMVPLTTAFLLGVVAYVSTGMFLTLAFERYFWLLLALAGAASAIALRGTPGEPPAGPLTRAENA